MLAKMLHVVTLTLEFLENLQWICAKLNVSEEISERACDHVYYHSKD